VFHNKIKHGTLLYKNNGKISTSSLHFVPFGEFNRNFDAASDFIRHITLVPFDTRKKYPRSYYKHISMMRRMFDPKNTTKRNEMTF
jgi:hypothetical protein